MHRAGRAGRDVRSRPRIHIASLNAFNAPLEVYIHYIDLSRCAAVLLLHSFFTDRSSAANPLVRPSTPFSPPLEGMGQIPLLLVAAWLEIDRRAAATKVKDARREMHRIWQDHKCRTFIPGVESGHEGPVSVDLIGKVLLIDQHERSTFALHDGINEGPCPNWRSSCDPCPRRPLTLGTGEVPKQGEEYAVFRIHARSRRVRPRPASSSSSSRRATNGALF